MRGCSSRDEGIKLGQENVAVVPVNFPSEISSDLDREKFSYELGEYNQSNGD